VKIYFCLSYLPIVRDDIKKDGKILPKRIRELIAQGNCEWTFRVNTCLCVFEEAYVKAKLPEKAAHIVEQNTDCERLLCFATSPVVHSVEVLFEEEWWPAWKAGDK